MPRLLLIFLLAALSAPANANADFAQAPVESAKCSATTAVISGYASNGSSAIFVSAYETSAWSGQIVSTLLTDSAKPNPDWGQPPLDSTAAKLDALASPDQRQILTHDGARGVPFRWESLSKAQQTQLQSHGLTNGYGSDLLQFIRGERGLESSKIATGFRPRASRQGDIVHSRMWHLGKPASAYAFTSYRDFAAQQAARTATLYVGGNDGMLHGFSAKTGDELLAYVPLGAFQNLHLLAARDYSHHYYVDGSPFTGDALIDGQWKTLLVGTMGAGGPGFFVLDVTSPGNFAENNASQLVVIDRTDGNDPDIGHIIAVPTLDETNAQRALQITQLNNGRWAVVLGNGYGSANGQPVLLIQYLDGARELLKISATASAAGGASSISNGLSAPQFLDINSDGIPDVVYAGDLQGHLWKFDIAAASDQRWNVALNGSPLFTAARDGKPQPITVAPVVRVHPDIGGLLIAFGTGQELSEADNADSAVQTVYSVMDYTRYVIQDSGADKGKVAVDATRKDLPGAASSRDELMSQSGAISAVAGGSGRSFWTLQGAPFAYCTRTPCATGEKKGWYLDLPVGRERVLDPLGFYGGGNVLEIISRVPATSSGACEQTFRTLLHIATGAPQKSRVLDTNGDGLVNAEDAPASRSTAASRELRLSSSNGRQTRQGSDGKTDRLDALPMRVKRPSWRHLK